MSDRGATVELITIGDELLLGFTLDSNGAYIARKLADIGVAVARRASVGDTLNAIVAVVSEALDRTGAVITTGGLGPTDDDLTRDAVALAFGRALVLDEAHMEWMRERWRKRFGRELPGSNRRQALIPEGARKLDNRHGSAPGVYIEDDRGRWLVMLPGVPREARGMTDDTLIPLLREKVGPAAGAVIRSRTLRTTGIGESLLADKLEADAAVRDAKAAGSMAYLPGVDGTDLRVTVHGADEREADDALDRVAMALRNCAGEYIYGEATDDMARVLLDRCRARHVRLSVAESCTGGLLGARLTSIAGSSDVFVGGVIAYANEVKVRDLGVQEHLIAEHGAVSEQVVRAMATGASQKFGTDVALAITGVAGPGGGTDEKPVGLVWIAVASANGVEPRKLNLWGDREEIRYRATQAVMDLARRIVA
ncbi:MAG TPA: competence/damage-inducible protein A [Gemmatimonadaceae bacterium]|nr:competence/damage-inducible protein A [Gemmatimonadaceae bacterium]